MVIADRIKALEAACRLMGLYKDDQAPRRVDINIKAMMAQVKFEDMNQEVASQAYMRMIQAKLS